MSDAILKNQADPSPALSHPYEDNTLHALPPPGYKPEPATPQVPVGPGGEYMINEVTSKPPYNLPSPSPTPKLGMYLKELNKKGNALGNMANSAIESPLGQKALAGASNLYENLPQGVRNGIGNMAASVTHQDPTKNLPGFTPTPNAPVYVQNKTTVQNEEVTNDNINTVTPGTAGSPLGQVARGVMTGHLPNKTFPQGSKVNEQVGTNNEEITFSRLSPGVQPHKQEPAAVGQKLGMYLEALNKLAKANVVMHKEDKNPSGGLTQHGRDKYNRETGSHLKAPVTQKNPKGEAKGRKASFCARMSGVKGPMKDEHGKPTRKALALRKWNCS